MSKIASPIEAKLRDAISDRCGAEGICLYDYCDGETGAVQVDNGRAVLECIEAGDAYCFGDEDADHWQLYSGVRVLSYKLDLLLVGPDGGVAIECDGFEWHERTKQQAAADRARDRELLAIGLATIRFTGSEIHHYPDRCAADAYRCARSESARGGELMRGHELGYQRGIDVPVCPRDVEIFALLADHPSLIGTEVGEEACAVLRDVRLRIAYNRAKRGGDLLSDPQCAWLSAPAQVASVVAQHPFARAPRPRTLLRILTEAASAEAGYVEWPERLVEEHW
jgi:hypothetical protein